MTRKDLLKSASILAAVSLAGKISADEDHSHHKTTGKTFEQLAHCAALCVENGSACLRHCIDILASGDKSIANCAKSVQDLIPVCNTLMALASTGSPFLKKYAAVCIEVCKACEEECNKHAKKHSVCKECADSCKECIVQLKKIA
ncbi:MAG: four-helix bundle copper-binding protein [Leptospira sp.]|nr:four-helix bundle copper-binding protein [Leptospira sp.]